LQDRQQLVAARRAFQRQRQQAVDQRVDQVLGQLGGGGRCGIGAAASAASAASADTGSIGSVLKSPATALKAAAAAAASPPATPGAALSSEKLGSWRDTGVSGALGPRRRSSSAHRHDQSRRRVRRSSWPCIPGSCYR
jgi:hypothetical protein